MNVYWTFYFSLRANHHHSSLTSNTCSLFLSCLSLNSFLDFSQYPQLYFLWSFAMGMKQAAPFRGDQSISLSQVSCSLCSCTSLLAPALVYYQHIQASGYINTPNARYLMAPDWGPPQEPENAPGVGGIGRNLPQSSFLNSQIPEGRLMACCMATRRARSRTVSKLEGCQRGHHPQPMTGEYKLTSQRHSLSLLKIEPLYMSSSEESSEGFWPKSILRVQLSQWFTNFYNCGILCT